MEATEVTELPVLRPIGHRPQLAVEPRTHVSCLYPELLALIFGFLCVRDRGRAAQVCQAWRDAADRKSVWRGAEARLHLRRANPALFASLARRGIRRVQVLSVRRSLRDVVHGVPQLQSLDLRGCFSVNDAALALAFAAEAPCLTRLDLSLCKQVTDAALGRIAQAARNLEELELGGCCNVTNTGLMLIAWGLRRLRRLNLRSCWHVSDLGIGHLAGVTKEVVAGTPDLEHLGLQDCQRVSDEALRHIARGLPRLRSLNLSFSVNVSDGGLKHLARVTSLRELNLRACENISDSGIGYLSEGGSRLTSLDVSFCDKVGDAALGHVAQGMFHVQVLSLSACPISDEGLCRLARALPELETLNIGQCSRISDTGILEVADSMRNLRSIDLYGCTRITTPAIQNVMRLPRLVTLNLGLWHVR